MEVWERGNGEMIVLEWGYGSMGMGTWQYENESIHRNGRMSLYLQYSLPVFSIPLTTLHTADTKISISKFTYSSRLVFKLCLKKKFISVKLQMTTLHTVDTKYQNVHTVARLVYMF